MSETSDLIAQSIERVLADQVDRAAYGALESGQWPERLWNALEQAGFTSLLGAPGSSSPAQWSDAYPVFHALGRHAAPVPLAETAIASFLLAAHGLPAREGPLAFFDFQDDPQASATHANGGVCLDGRVPGVPWARWARALVVAASIEGRPILALIDAGADGLSIQHGANLAGEPRDAVELRSCRANAYVLLDPPGLAVDIECYGALMRSAMMAGAIEMALQRSAGYATERIQFGKPIAKFQAIQQSLAGLAGEATSAQSAALAAFGSVAGVPGHFETGVAKIRTGKAAGIAASIAHQVHGAIGFTWEHPLHHSTQRLWAWRAEYGTEAQWALRLGREAITRRSAHFWPDITAHHIAAAQ
ncbi:MAG: acyl-CoA/acyl-ACP dehydrogenase [Burkholderiaceae bacterium]|jgi:alkylation response protein AidB-like acyl-CoA dehydrogenase|nr:acyl-CoA/acyl-ACP dehydrogenase [Burkholderiaceae bacterium]